MTFTPQQIAAFAAFFTILASIRERQKPAHAGEESKVEGEVWSIAEKRRL
jgi:hypothetical protein